MFMIGAMTYWTPTPSEGEKIRAAFTPRMGRRYAKGRNTDHGSDAHKALSALSPFTRRRLVLESDAAAAALAAHGREDAKKFVQEVTWRGYFKGWLERRPQVWDSYRSGLEADLAACVRYRGLRRDVDRATGDQTGLKCFDAWVTELVDTCYLHNHARMWFISIWVFTLGLPLRLGADFFYRHLLEGDAASDTRGWPCGANARAMLQAMRCQAGTIWPRNAPILSPAPLRISFLSPKRTSHGPQKNLPHCRYPRRRHRN
jgi:deoxyribodipyrimidine photo-lyase